MSAVEITAIPEEHTNLIVRIYDALKGHSDWNDKKSVSFLK